MTPPGPRPWKRLRRGAEHDYSVMKVREDTMEDPRDGSPHPRLVLASVDWVNVLAITKEDEVVFVRQFRNGIAQVTLELPGGMVDEGEEPGRAAARELEEETGFRAGSVVPLGFVHPNPAMQTNRCHAFLALDCQKVHGGQQDAGEDIQVELHPRRELGALVKSGAITHALIVATFYLATLEGKLP